MPHKSSSNVNDWIENRIDQQVKALEEASKIFDEKDALTVNIGRNMGRKVVLGKINLWELEVLSSQLGIFSKRKMRQLNGAQS